MNTPGHPLQGTRLGQTAVDGTVRNLYADGQGGVYPEPPVIEHQREYFPKREYFPNEEKYFVTSSRALHLKYNAQDPTTGPKKFELVHAMPQAERAIYLVDDEQGFYQALADFAQYNDNADKLTLPDAYPCLVEYHIPREGRRWDTVFTKVIDAPDFLLRYNRAEDFYHAAGKAPVTIEDLLNGWARDRHD